MLLDQDNGDAAIGQHQLHRGAQLVDNDRRQSLQRLVCARDSDCFSRR
jgi:hypothetical protein